MPHLIDPAALADLAASSSRVRILDVRWRLDRPDGRPDFLTGHLPGAVFVHLGTELSRPGSPDEGRHPLPTRDALEDAARGWGLDDGDTVVVYDDWNSVSAARAWWLLRGSGVDDVRVLDGGLSAWIDAGLPLETGEVAPRRGSVVLSELGASTVTIDEAAAWAEQGVLLDARAPERYRGDIEPIDPVAGHIPGARNLPAAALLDGSRFRRPDELAAAFDAVGARSGAPVAAYCGSGVTAAHTALAGAVAGIDVAVYPGSWSAWSNTPGRAIATGADPSEVTGTV
ncbi:sulfurtransferase [Microbacterium sp. SSM24]|uniref:sulfurtransferase n=1 Tax=Microbacterium sp. SSM24 TaxID=2991714 RepID=UPI00222761B3|nr:sulfurtransferase [Microbacterium sp. SSM24]MCW3491861.1 sulfurtransferase [Microbacterium sp. SSM24]